jgi:prepilin-type N-terminal cleavage/methylation domain-containing protein
MKRSSIYNKRGVTLIELLVVLVISSVVMAGVYRLFISQSKAYTVQDQVAEVQQSIRSAMEILLRDLRMTGFDDDNTLSTVTIVNPIDNPLSDTSIKVNYEYYDTTDLTYKKYTVAYWRDASSNLMRELSINDVVTNTDILLENVNVLNFTYGIDTNSDGAVESWVSAAGVGSNKVIAVRVTLTARPTQVNPDLLMVSPRTLVSAVTFRNLLIK